MQCDDEQKYSAFSLFSCAYSWRILLSTTSMNVYVMGCSQCPALAAKYSSNLTSQPGLKVNNVTVQALCMRHAGHGNQHIHPAGGCLGHLCDTATRVSGDGNSGDVPSPRQLCGHQPATATLSTGFTAHTRPMHSGRRLYLLLRCHRKNICV